MEERRGKTWREKAGFETGTKGDVKGTGTVVEKEGRENWQWRYKEKRGVQYPVGLSHVNISQTFVTVKSLPYSGWVPTGHGHPPLKVKN